MGCISTPMPNHLSTLKPRKEVWRTHSTTSVWRRKERSGMNEKICKGGIGGWNVLCFSHRCLCSRKSVLYEE